VVLRLIPDIVRDVGNRTADPTLDWALAGQKLGVVVALGLTGREAIHPSEPYADHFAEAARHGLHCTAHAGEHAGARSVAAVLVGAVLGLAVATSVLPTGLQDVIFRTPLAIVVLLFGTIGLLVWLVRRPNPEA